MTASLTVRTSSISELSSAEGCPRASAVSNNTPKQRAPTRHTISRIALASPELFNCHLYRALRQRCGLAAALASIVQENAVVEGEPQPQWVTGSQFRTRLASKRTPSRLREVRTAQLWLRRQAAD